MRVVPTDAALVFDPDLLTAAQRDGDACIVCHKRWPRPRKRVARLPNGVWVRDCEDCASVVRTEIKSVGYVDVSVD